MGSLCETKNILFLNLILGTLYSDHMCTCTIVLILVFISICDKLCIMHCDINERLVVVEIRLQCPRRANYTFKEPLIHIVVDHMVCLMIIYALGGHRYCLRKSVKYCPLLILHSTIIYTR